MMIDHYFVDRFFRAATISWVEFDERSVEGLVQCAQFHRTFSWALHNLFCDRTHMHCDAVTSEMMIDHKFFDRFFRAATISWAEFDECNEEGPRNCAHCTKIYHNRY